MCIPDSIMMILAARLGQSDGLLFFKEAKRVARYSFNKSSHEALYRSSNGNISAGNSIGNITGNITVKTQATPRSAFQVIAQAVTVTLWSVEDLLRLQYNLQ